MRKEIVIVGGGASGMVAAIVAARLGAQVTLIEQKNELGKKLLATGNGRCNYTNLDMKPEHFYINEPEFLEEILLEYTPQHIQEFFHSVGVLGKERNGYVYPITDQATSIRDGLVAELKKHHVEIMLETGVQSIQIKEKTYAIQLEKMDDSGRIYHIECEKLILATGGKSGLNKASKYHGYSLIHNTNHGLTTLSPALVPLIGQGRFYKKIAGIRTDAKVTAIIGDKIVGMETGELQLTDYGVSGIPIFQISRLITQALEEKQSATKESPVVEIDFLPSYDLEALEVLLRDRQKDFPERTMKLFLNGLFKDKLAAFLLNTARIEESMRACEVSEEQWKKLASISKTFRVKVEGYKDFPQSQVTAGGVPINEITNKLESIYHKNLYFTGEVLDIDGICGGYNLHWAWTSGMIVGKECCK